jgi:predicted AlkP superfamily phosphohydrolase/phosphomutase
MTLKSRLPLGLQDRLGMYWRAGSRDWTKTRAFPLTADVDGYVRVNLRGREAAGTVEPGAEYEDLCRLIAEGIQSFVDADTGEPIVEDVISGDACFPGASRRNDLPDLILQWRATPAARHRQLASPRFGTLDWRTPGKMPNGRSGNHNATGFLLAVGSGIAPGSHLAGGHMLDIPPTVYALFGLAPPSHMTGQAIREIASTGAGIS